MSSVVLMRNSFFLFLVLAFTLAKAQTKISGVVTDIDGNSVPFANVVFKNDVQLMISDSVRAIVNDSLIDYVDRQELIDSAYIVNGGSPTNARVRPDIVTVIPLPRSWLNAKPREPPIETFVTLPDDCTSRL